MKYLGYLPLCLLLSITACRFLPDPQFEGPFQVPRGFVVEMAALPEQTGSLVQMTFDSLGRPVVSKERGHPTILFDNDRDGLFETEKVFSDKVKDAQGLWFDGRTLYAIANGTENGKAGLYRLEDLDGDDIADTFETLTLFTGPMGEHGPHEIRRGPDGHPTVLVGNHSFVPSEMIDPLSPLRGYQEAQLLERYMDSRGHAAGIMAPGGSIFRLDRGSMKYSLLLGGFRNPYNHAYNWEGEMFTYDSDMEWDLNLPWYREVRSVHCVPGGDYGWRTGSGKLPDYYLDTLPPLEDLKRGSPVGVEFYHHYAYPKEYFDAFLQGDWSRGRVVLTRLARNGATYQPADASGDFVYGEPLNVTDLEVGPDGFLYFTMGGRNTEGGFYRVAYRGYRSNWEALPKDGILAATRQPQPLSSWGHAELLKRKTSLGDAWGPELQRIAKDTGADSRDRLHAVLLLARLGPKPDAALLQTLGRDNDAAVRAAAAYAAGLQNTHGAKAVAAAALKDSDPLVQRRAAEALVRMGLSADQPSLAPVADIHALLNSPDRFVRHAGRLALERTPREEWKTDVLQEQNPLGAIEGLLALTRTARDAEDLEPVFEKQISLLKRELSADNELRLLRALHLSCIQLEKGCRAALRKQVYDIVAPRFPAADERLNREYARTMAYSGEPGAIAEILAAMPPGDENQPLQIHYAYCLRAIQQGWTPSQKKQLLAWFSKAKDWRGGASLPGYVNNMFDSSLAFFDAEEKKMAYATIPEFAPLTEEELAALRARREKMLAMVRQMIDLPEDFEIPEEAQVYARRRGVSNVSEQEIFEYMMYDPMTTKAQPEHGREMYEKECSKCHRFGDLGKDFGPDLTTIANRFKRKDIVEAVLWPSRTISDQYEAYIVETTDNDILLGMIQSEDNEKLVMLLPDEERPVVVPKLQIKDKRISKVSTMPDRLLDGYEMQQIASLFAFLEKGANGAAATSE